MSFPPRFTSKDVTVVIPTLGQTDNFSRCILSIYACSPKIIVVVTPKLNVERIQKLCKSLRIENVKILGAPQANKRLQMVQGIETVVTAVTVFADDDVFWHPKFLIYTLAAFENENVGAAGGLTSASRDQEVNVWEFLGTCYLERWNFDIAATSHIDGGLPCLSGSTQAVLTKIVQDPAFINHFTSEKWFGRVSLLGADDDNSLTRWLFTHGWKIKLQYAMEATLTTGLKHDSAFLGQCVRWSRTTWRSNTSSLWTEKKLW